jgi:lipopolysaccharide biosynthesis regulator YciM
MAALVLGYGGWIGSSRSPTSETNELYVRGRMLLDGWTPGGVRAALGVFEQLVALEPTHAGAHAGMALAYLQRPSGINGIDPAVALERGRQAVERALALDASEPEAYSALAELCLRRRDWSGARDALRRAVELGPTNVRIRAQFADLLALQGRFDEALVEARIGESPIHYLLVHGTKSHRCCAMRDDSTRQLHKRYGRLRSTRTSGRHTLRSVMPTWR